MFEIGSSLREARERQKLELRDIERETRIRAKYLQALEEERFDVLPGPAYAKGFLHTYADHLGLDGRRFVEEYGTRFPPAEEAPGVTLVRVRRPRRLLGTRLVAVLVAVSIGLFVWRTTSGGGHHHAGLTHAPAHVRAAMVTRQGPPAAPRRLRTARIVLVAARGSCWLLVRRGTPPGRVIYERTLERGQTVGFSGTRLWIRLGA